MPVLCPAMGHCTRPYRNIVILTWTSDILLSTQNLVGGTNDCTSTVLNMQLTWPVLSGQFQSNIPVRPALKFSYMYMSFNMLYMYMSHYFVDMCVCWCVEYICGTPSPSLEDFNKWLSTTKSKSRLNTAAVRLSLEYSLVAV